LRLTPNMKIRITCPLKYLLNKIVAEKYDVTIFGTRDPNTSSPELLWAVSTKEKL
jgi:hypothetical protein